MGAMVGAGGVGRGERAPKSRVSTRRSGWRKREGITETVMCNELPKRERKREGEKKGGNMIDCVVRRGTDARESTKLASRQLKPRRLIRGYVLITLEHAINSFSRALCYARETQGWHKSLERIDGPAWLTWKFYRER